MPACECLPFGSQHDRPKRESSMSLLCCIGELCWVPSQASWLHLLHICF